MTSTDTMDRHSLYRQAWREAEEYRDQLIGRLGRKFEDEAKTEWNRDHWWKWAAGRVIQHLLGECYWIELGPEKFASISKETPERLQMMEELNDVQGKLIKDTLLAFEVKEELQRQRAELVNRLLD